MAFTDKYLKSIKPKTQSYRIFERAADKGFGIKVSSAGTLSFFLQYASPTTGRRAFLTIGTYPALTLAKAREKARAARALLEDGRDPRGELDRPPGTVNDLFGHYIDTMRRKGRRSVDEVDRVLTKWARPEIGTLPARAITPAQIRNILRACLQGGTRGTSNDTQTNRLRSYLHTAWKTGIHADNDPHATGRVRFALPGNPVGDVPRDAAAERAHDRALTWTEIRWLWHPCGLERHHALALRLLLATGGQRPGEVIGAAVAEFDLDARLWTIPPERTKNKRYHLVPLTDLACDLVREALHWRPTDDDGTDSQWLFPARRRVTIPQYTTTLAHELKKWISRPEESPFTDNPFTPRDLRRTWKTRAGEIGIPKDVRDRIQNHALQDVSSEHYDRYDYLKEKRQALEAWETALKAAMARTGDNTNLAG